MRLRPVLHLHSVNRMQAFAWPLITTSIALAIVLVIGAIIGGIDETARAGMSEGMRWNGAIFALLGPMIGYGFVSMGQYFPLALGLGLTRREFAAGLSLVFVLNAVAYTAIVTIGKAIERATGGFGLDVRFFDVVYTSTGSLGQTIVQTFVLILLVLFLGAAITTAFQRFGQPVLWLGGALLALIAVGIFAAVVFVDGVGARLLDLLGMGWAGWMGVAALVAVLAAGVWLLLVRRTQVA